jgi:diguanylate cyclase (GGDEF)-like protein
VSPALPPAAIYGGGLLRAKCRARLPQFLRNLAILSALAAAYVVAGKLGLRLAFVHASATAVWPPAGIGLAAFLILGYRVWPAILLGAFLVNLATAGTAATSLCIATGNTLEGLVGAYLVNQRAGGRYFFKRGRDVFGFALLAAILSTTVSATTGVTTLSLAGFASWSKYGAIWLTWWLGDATGDLVVAPFILVWSADCSVRGKRGQVVETAALLLSLCLVGRAVFAGLLGNYPLEFLCAPILIWSAYRFSPREAATALVVLSGIAIHGTLRGHGPFVRASGNDSLLLLQAFLAIKAMMTLALAAVVSERKKAEEEMRWLAVTDAVTGLANYRRFIDALEGEIRRSERSGRLFALLVLDLDNLKKVNDRHGHLVGTRALCRLADVLRMNCRAVDTAARFGGDEFALILIETGEVSARQVAFRISAGLASDGQKPELSVSVGVAMYPHDGDTLEALLRAADSSMYDTKRRGGKKTLVPRLAERSRGARRDRGHAAGTRRI